jgi:hypothetical protein
MERPEPVSRVKPPTASMAIIKAATARSHRPTARRLGMCGMLVDAAVLIAMIVQP